MAKDLYALLGVAHDAEAEVIAAAYRAMAKKYHPDINHDEGANRKLQDINEAYSILSDHGKRMAYDETLSCSRHAEENRDEDFGIVDKKSPDSLKNLLG